jgi:hypothetical protein
LTGQKSVKRIKIVQLKLSAMKKILVSMLMIATICTTSFARKFVAEGKTHSALGNYKIEVDESFMMINGKSHRPYVITYENSGLELRVAVDMERGRKIYYVLSDVLSVKYVSNRHYFGIERLEKEIENDGFRTSDSALNREEYFHQKALTSGKGWRRDNTKLIAAFFPALLNNPENILAVN